MYRTIGLDAITRGWGFTWREYGHGAAERRLVGGHLRRGAARARAPLRPGGAATAVDGVVEVERRERLEEAAPPGAAARRAPGPGGGRLEPEPQIDAPAELVEVVVRDAPHAPQRRAPAAHPAAAPLPRLIALDVGRPRVLLLQPHRGRRGRAHLPPAPAAAAAAAAPAQNQVAPRLLHGTRPSPPPPRKAKGGFGEASFAVGGGGRGGFYLASAGWGRGQLRDVCRRNELVYIASTRPVHGIERWIFELEGEGR